MRIPWKVLVIGVSSLLATEAAAQDAESYFNEGKKAFTSGDMQTAYDAYQKSWALRKSPDTSCNLGNVEVELKRYRAAAEHLAYCLRTFPASAGPDKRALAEEVFAKAKAQVATVTLTSTPTGATLTIDGEPAGRTPLEDEVFLDPGSHTLRAELANYEAVEQAIDVTAGEQRDLNLELSPVEVATEGPMVEPIFAETERPVWPLLVFGGVGVAGLGVGIVGLVLKSGARSDADDFEVGPEGCDATCADTIQGHLDDEATFGTLSVIGFVGAGVALATGIVLHFALESETTAAGLPPRRTLWLAPTGQGAILGGTF